MVQVGAYAREPSLGEVVVVRSPASGDLVIKRVAAGGGQTVAIADGVLKVDGKPVPEPYVDRAQVDGTFFGPVRVPPGSVFLLGDQRLGSVDSPFDRSPDPSSEGGLPWATVLRSRPTDDETRPRQSSPRAAALSQGRILLHNVIRSRSIRGIPVWQTTCGDGVADEDDRHQDPERE